MILNADSFGEFADVLNLLGLANDNGSLNEDWLSAPGDYLKNVLASEHQRAALLRLLEEKLEGQKETDAQGRIWLPIISADGDVATFFFVIDQAPTDHVRISLGTRIKTTDPDSATSFLFPLFRAHKESHSVSDPLLFGNPGGILVLTSEIIVDPVPAAPGAAGLRSVGVSFEIPTHSADGHTSVSILLGGLQLPGGSSPSDIALSASAADDLDNAALDLILGLIQAQAGGAGNAQIAALAELMGLGGTIPPLPLDDLFSTGVSVLSDWFADVIGSAATKSVWLSALAELLGGGSVASVSGETLSLDLGSSNLDLTIRTERGASGRPVVTPSVTFALTEGAARVECIADLVRIDLGTGEARAVPSVKAQFLLGTPASPILTGDPTAQTLRAGIELNQARQPVVILALDQVVIGVNTYPTLDLSTPDAIADAATSLISDVVANLLSQLGSAGSAISILLGIAAPAGAPTLPTLDLAAFMADPLSALLSHWKNLLSAHQTEIPLVLAELRSLIVDASLAGDAVTGTGTKIDPWRISLVGPVALIVWSDGAELIKLGFSLAVTQVELGERCTVIETVIDGCLFETNLLSAETSFASVVELRLDARPRGQRRAAIGIDQIQLEADKVSVSAIWSAVDGFGLNFSTPNPALKFETVDIPLDLPAFDQGFEGLSEAQWDAIEMLMGILLDASRSNWVRDLVVAFGWRRTSTIGGGLQPIRLALSRLATAPDLAIREWITDVLLRGGAELRSAMQPLARIFNGSTDSFGVITGTGHPTNPFAIPLAPLLDGPKITTWVEPSGPPSDIGAGVSEALRFWRPGLDGLDPFSLAQALIAEQAGSAGGLSVFGTLNEVSLGIEALRNRWIGSDGRITPPVTLPAGMTQTFIDSVTEANLRDKVDLDELFGAMPPTVIHIAVAAETDAWPFPGAPDAMRIDLRAPNRAPDTFAAPSVSTGTWFIAVAPRAAAQLATGDPDGALGQAQRLVRIFPAFESVAGDVCVIADAAASHAAWIAADEVGTDSVSHMVTLGMALSPISLSIFDVDPGASALRLLTGLLPDENPSEADDDDLSAGRALLGALTDLFKYANPAADLSPPPALPSAVSGGLKIHAIYGRFDIASIERAMTAVVAAGLSTRAFGRFETGITRTVTGAGFGLCLPITADTSGITVSGHAMVELIGIDATGGTVDIRTASSLRIRTEIRRANGWLLGGPGSGASPEHELHWAEIDLSIPLQAGGVESASVILHDARIFDILRDHWTLASAGFAVDDGIATTTLPEVQVLLSSLMAELSSEVSPKIVALRGLMRAIGVIDDADALIAAALDRLLHEPAKQVVDALGDATRLSALSDAVTELFGGFSGVSIDVPARTVSVSLAGISNSKILSEWALDASVSAAGDVTGALSLGRIETGCLSITSAPVSATFKVAPADAMPITVSIWPNPTIDTMVDFAPRFVAATAIRLVLSYTRELDSGARPIIDAALDAVGLLDVADPEGARAIIAPISLLADPVGWFRRDTVFGAVNGGFEAERIITFMDALKPILGVAGGRGAWRFADGFEVRATGIGNTVDIGLSLDSAAFQTQPSEMIFSGQIGLRLGATGSPQPTADIFFGLPSPQTGRNSAHLVIDGDVALFLRPSVGADIALYPSPAGLGALATTSVSHALPLILNAVVSNGGSAGSIIAAIGDGLDLREGAPVKFTAARLQAWASDPADELETRWTSIASSALGQIATALDPELPTSVNISGTASGLAVTVGSFELGFETNPFCLRIAFSDTGLPVIETVSSTLIFDGAGLKDFSAEIGPAIIPAGGTDLFPVYSISVGHSIATPSLVLGLALAADGDQRLVMRALFDPVRFEIAFDDGTVVSTDSSDVAAGLLMVIIDLLSDFVFQTTAMDTFLSKSVPGTGSSTIEDVLKGVLLRDIPLRQLDTSLFRFIPTVGQSVQDILDSHLARILKLIENFADAQPFVDIDGILRIELARTGGSIGLSVALSDRLDLTTGDVVVSLENDSRWIKGGPQADIVIGLLDVSSSTADFAPSIAANGVGVRIARQNGPLLDIGLSLGSIALHFFGRVGSGPLAGGVQIQLSDLAVGVTGNTGGNPVAGGIMGEASGSGEELAPAFSPALAVQKDGNGPVMVSLSAGEGDGPWWLSIRKGFGPLYVDQVGFGVTVDQVQLKKISVFFDGSISIVGLTAAVDDLQLTYSVTGSKSVFDSANWDVDLAGLAVSADISGVTLAGGLRKYVDAARPDDVEYIGMLMARFGTYGLSVYGGYASITVEPDGKFTAFFAYGAIVGPIGGPPAFFLTGIGGGFGINRDIVVPEDLSAFDEFVMIKALDPSAAPSDDPLEEMDEVRRTLPAKQGHFWFAAGISFTSFAVVDGIAVVAVEFGYGFELNIFGLARMALPRPQVALVSIELGLIARFSSEEGVIWIQAQLTDNSWLLHESVRLTGGFAFVSWFGGPNKGQFVLTLGGYHPNFQRDGYPQVPRLGIHWEPSSNIVIKGENYFALTSEAVMAGGGLEASATFGPAWAHVSFGANVIIYFDPFRYEADAHARISAGITINFWIGKVTISISLGARIEVMGPEFRGSVTFEVGPAELTVDFGANNQSSPNYLTWSEFVPKYLEESSNSRAAVLSSLTGKGSIPPGARMGEDSESGTADGTVDHPFEVMSEFELSVTGTVPTNQLRVGTRAPDTFNTSLALGLPPLNATLSSSELSLSLKKVGSSTERLNNVGITTTARDTGFFPAAVWGPPQDPNNKKIPKGEVISAVEGAHMLFEPQLVNKINQEIAFNQIEAGPRQPLPFLQSTTTRPNLLTKAAELAAIIPTNPTDMQVFELSGNWMVQSGLGATAQAAWERRRAAPPRLASLAERLDIPQEEATKKILQRAKPKDFDLRILPPKAVALFTQPTRVDMTPMRTTVSTATGSKRIAPPNMASVTSQFNPAVAAHLERIAPAAVSKKTVVPVSVSPKTTTGRGNAAFVTGRGADATTRARLTALDAMATGTGARRERISQASGLLPGEIAVFEMPNARRAPVDVQSGVITLSGGTASLTAFGLGGTPVLALPEAKGRVELPPQVERIAVVATGTAQTESGLNGWVAGRELAYIGWSTALCKGGSVFVDGASLGRGPEKRGVGWVRASNFVRRGAVTTRFSEFSSLLAILIEGKVDATDLSDFTISLDGARESDKNTPVVVDLGGQSALILSLVKGKREIDASFSLGLRFLSAANARISGVLASNGSADNLAKDLADRGPEALLTHPVQHKGKPVFVTWARNPSNRR